MVLGFAGMSFAQVTGTANLQVQVVTAMTMTVSGSLDFGSVPQGTLTSPAVAVGNGATFTVSGTDSASFEITLPTAPTQLTNVNDGTKIDFTPVLKCSVDGTTTGNNAADNTTYTLGALTSKNPGKYYFLLGGSVSVLSTSTAGVYKGTYTLTATY